MIRPKAELESNQRRIMHGRPSGFKWGVAVELMRRIGAWQDVEKRWRGGPGKAKTGEKGAVYGGVNEHLVPAFSAAMATQAVFQRPANPVALPFF
ncbi:MAG: hypothetical protein E6Q43_00335 [Dokdonella sp.]|nr:MAG: hypothetical protein EYC71_06910 [Gammaproteobacteria bacterium]TXI78019.1 MAG: hypothetical protein E6Q43_00335 [Dokdonella sp.]